MRSDECWNILIESFRKKYGRTIRMSGHFHFRNTLVKLTNEGIYVGTVDCSFTSKIVEIRRSLQSIRNCQWNLFSQILIECFNNDTSNWLRDGRDSGSDKLVMNIAETILAISWFFFSLDVLIFKNCTKNII